MAWREQRAPQERVVLAVDDEADHLLAYEVAFGRHPDLRLIRATTTAEAADVLGSVRVDAVLLDLAVPEEGGLALCRRIKSETKHRHMPVIALSALPGAIFAGQALASGCAAFLQKPCRLSQIVAAVRAHLTLAHLVG